MRLRQSAFTLLEMLIVVIILGILASVAIPRYLKSAERSKDAEAYVHLGLIRTAEVDYYAQHNSYTNNLDLLNVDNPNNLPPPPVGTRLFVYSVQPAPPMSTFTGVAVRTAGTTTYTITMDHNGRTTRTVNPP